MMLASANSLWEVTYTLFTGQNGIVQNSIRSVAMSTAVAPEPDINALLFTEESAPKPDPSQYSPQNQDVKELVYRRQTGMNCASTLLAPKALQFSNLDELYAKTVELSERIVHYLNTGEAHILQDNFYEEGM